MKTDSPGQRQDPHRSLHSETGALPGEHPGRSKNPLIKVAGLAWLEFEKPDLEAAEKFLADFGFTVARPDTGDAAAARPVGGPGVPDRPARPSLPLRRHRLPGRRPR